MSLRGLPNRLLTTPLAVPGVVVLVLAAVTINEWTHQRTREVRIERLALLQARTAGMQALQLLTDAETAQRGYLLTGRLEYLQPYEAALRALPQQLGPAIAFLRGAGEQAAARAAEAEQLFELRLGELSTTIALNREGRREEALNMVVAGLGKATMDRLRAKLTGALDSAAAKDVLMEAAIQAELRLRRWTVNLLAVVSGIAALGYIHKLRNETRLQVQARARLEEEVQARTADLRELASNLQTVQEEERARLSRELHDELGGLLTAAKFDLVRLRNAREPEQQAERLQQIGRRLDDVVAIKRRIIEDLRPSSLQHLGLRKALELLCSEVSERLGTPVLTRLDNVELRDDAELTVFRLVQEALTNVQKYARADHVGVMLVSTADQITVSIEDNGAGFDVLASRVARHGLAGMRHRVESFGGRLELDSAPGRGTRVTASLPMASVAPAAGSATPA